MDGRVAHTTRTTYTVYTYRTYDLRETTVLLFASRAHHVRNYHGWMLLLLFLMQVHQFRSPFARARLSFRKLQIIYFNLILFRLDDGRTGMRVRWAGWGMRGVRDTILFYKFYLTVITITLFPLFHFPQFSFLNVRMTRQTTKRGWSYWSNGRNGIRFRHGNVSGKFATWNRTWFMMSTIQPIIIFASPSFWRLLPSHTHTHTRQSNDRFASKSKSITNEQCECVDDESPLDVNIERQQCRFAFDYDFNSDAISSRN